MGPRSAEILNDVEMIPGIEDPGGKHLVLIRLEGLEEWLVVDPELATKPKEVSSPPGRCRRRLLWSVVETSIVFTHGHSQFPT
jgi:hypothetical protein